MTHAEHFLVGFAIGVVVTTVLFVVMIEAAVPEWSFLGLDARCMPHLGRALPELPCVEGTCIQFLPEHTRYVCMERAWRPIIEGR